MKKHSLSNPSDEASTNCVLTVKQLLVELQSPGASAGCYLDVNSFSLRQSLLDRDTMYSYCEAAFR